MKIAIYDPEPRICGPDTWADALRWGFRELGHQCDVIALTKSGKRSPAWGRVEPDKSSSLSCALTVDRSEKYADAGRVFDEYDLLILTDLKTATRDNETLKDPFLDRPLYVDAIDATSTPWTSAMHGRWYWAQPDPTPEGLQEKSGSPFLHDLLAAGNFSGFLLSHARDFDRYSTPLKTIRRKVVPLPYRPKHTLAEALDKTDDADSSLATIGRMIPTKHRHVIVEAMCRGMLPGWTYHVGGGCVCTHGPSESYLLYESMIERGWEGDWVGGVRQTQPFMTKLDTHRCATRYHGAYVDPNEVLRHAQTHVGITDCDFSGGLLEFATLEAIDCGCMPIVARDFEPHCGTMAEHWLIDFSFRKFTAKVAQGWDDELYYDMADVICEANRAWTPELVEHNRNMIARENDPRETCKILLEECL